MSAETVFDDLATQLAESGAIVGRMFGVRALLLGDKVFACQQGDLIALKLGAGSPEHAEALALPGAEPWDAPRRGRPYKDWVAVTVEENSELEDTELGDLGAAALRFLEKSRA